MIREKRGREGMKAGRGGRGGGEEERRRWEDEEEG